MHQWISTISCTKDFRESAVAVIDNLIVLSAIFQMVHLFLLLSSLCNSAASERKTLTNRTLCLFSLNTIISLAQR